MDKNGHNDKRGVLDIPKPRVINGWYGILEIETFMTPREMSRFIPWYKTKEQPFGPELFSEKLVREFLDAFRYGRR